MRKYILLLVAFAFINLHAFSQETVRKPGVGWFITPEYSVMFLDNHVGNAVGVSFGVKLLKDHLKVGFYNYCRSGPINAKTFPTQLPEGVRYKGKEVIDLRADHGAFGLMVAPSFYLPKTNIEIDIPIYFGSIGAGFYLAGDDRKTPDNRRVSEWENELFNGEDAAFASMLEVGLRAFIPTGVDGLCWGLGLHYTTVQDWSTYADPSGDFFNNKFRASVFVDLGSKARR